MNSNNLLVQGDALKIPLLDRSVHCAVTSPPYWGLRKYSGEQGRIWGGDLECEHEWGGETKKRTGRNDGDRSKLSAGSYKPGLEGDYYVGKQEASQGQFCQLCNAWYGSLGLEPTPELHIENIVGIGREVWRVLRPDGVFWVNYGDCYFHDIRGDGGWQRGAEGGLPTRGDKFEPVKLKMLSQGNLMLMPHRVALALQQDGWIIRQDLVWNKPNPMPESQAGWRWQRERTRDPEWSEKRYAGKGEDPQGRTERLKMNVASARAAGVDHEVGAVSVGWEYGDDLELRRGSWRHTRAHEYVFMLVKGPKMSYWSNQEAVREITGIGTNDRGTKRNPPGENAGIGHEGWVSYMTDDDGAVARGRNPRSVLDIPTAPYKGAHYATFPPNLIAPLIRATCPRWACPVCGQGWAPVVEKQGGRGHDWNTDNRNGKDRLIGGRHASESMPEDYSVSILGYRRTCEHEHTQEEAVPGIVFDPFVGSGTTVAVAKQLLRRGIGIDISMEYLDQQAKIRTGNGMPSKALEGLPLFEAIHD